MIWGFAPNPVRGLRVLENFVTEEEKENEKDFVGNGGAGFRGDGGFR